MTSMAELAAQLGIAVGTDEEELFDRYQGELLAWNERAGLTTVTATAEIRRIHFLDSLGVFLAGPLPQVGRVVDVGAGGGFPGVPLKICRPDLELVLVEANARKAAFLRHLVEILDLAGVRVYQERAEVVGRDPDLRERFDLAVARAVAALPVLLEYTLPLVALGGEVVALKGPRLDQELAAGEEAGRVLGGGEGAVISFTLPEGGEERRLAVWKKVKATPVAYPRRPGMAAKRPLGSKVFTGK